MIRGVSRMNFKPSQDNFRQRWFCYIQIVLMMLIIYGNGRVTNADYHSAGDEYHNLRLYLGKLCRSLDSMRHLSDIRAMVVTIKAMSKLAPSNDSGQIPPLSSPNDNNNHGVFVSWSDYWTLGQDPARLCLENAPAILDLGPIIDEKTNVCKSSHIDLLEAYKKKYLDITTRANNNNRITKRFFNLYTNQVSFICKRNLIHSLQLADDKLSTKYVKVMPWLSEPPRECPINYEHDDTDSVYNNNNNNNNNHDNTESNHGFAPESPNRFHAGQLISDSLINDNKETDPEALRCRAIEALSSVKSINELVEVMEKDSSGQHDEHQSGQADGDLVGKNGDGRVSNLMLVIPDGDMRETVEQMLEACSQFKQIYSHTIEPIVRLIQMGINPTYKKFDERCRADILPQRWFSITLICHAMLRSRLADQKSQSDFKDDLADSKTGLIVVEDQIIQDREGPISTPTTTTTTDESQQQGGNELVVFKNPIEDELWVGKYLPGRFKRLRTKYISNLLEAFKIDKLRNSVVFKKNVKRGRSIIVTLLFVGLTLIGINSSPNL